MGLDFVNSRQPDSELPSRTHGALTFREIDTRTPTIVGISTSSGSAQMVAIRAGSVPPSPPTLRTPRLGRGTQRPLLGKTTQTRATEGAWQPKPTLAPRVSSENEPIVLAGSRWPRLCHPYGIGGGNTLCRPTRRRTNSRDSHGRR